MNKKYETFITNTSMNNVTYRVDQWHRMPALAVEVRDSVQDQVITKWALLSNQRK